MKRESVFETIRWIGGSEIWLETHKNPHFDEACACSLAEMCATKEWIEKHCPNGKLVLGINGGKFDEHKEGADGDCCTTLMAKSLGIFNQREIKNLIDYVKRVDIEGKSRPNNIDSVVKIINFFHGEKIGFNWLLEGIGAKLNHNGFIKPNFNLETVKKAISETVDSETAEAWYNLGKEALERQRQDFLTKTKVEFEKAGREVIKTGYGILKLVVIETNDTNMNKFARSKHGGFNDVIVIKKSTGNVQIFTNNRKVKSLDDVIRPLRYEEQKRSKNIQITNWGKLCENGDLGNWDVWFYMKEGKTILNGSLTAPDVRPTCIPFDKIVDIVKAGLSKEIKCVACQKSCDQYAWGLAKCRRFRYNLNYKK